MTMTSSPWRWNVDHLPPECDPDGMGGGGNECTTYCPANMTDGTCGFTKGYAAPVGHICPVWAERAAVALGLVSEYDLEYTWQHGDGP